jgi:hypothetical protein
MDLSPAMAKAIKESFEDGTIQGANRHIERALIRRGLADEVRGTATRRNRTSHFAQTVYDAYLGARLNEAGRELCARLLALDIRVYPAQESRLNEEN